MKVSVLGLPILGLALLSGGAFSQQDGRIYYGNRAGMHLTTVSKEGIGSAKAVIMLKHTPQDAKAFCEHYVQDNSTACVNRTLASVKVGDRVTGNCISKTWTDMHGRRYAFLGKGTKSDQIGPEYLLRDLSTGETLNGSSASGYSIQLTIFQHLCPGLAPDVAADPPSVPQPARAPQEVPSQPQSSGECLAAGKAVTGVLTTAQRTHPNGTPLKAFVLTLPIAMCAVDTLFTHLRNGSASYTVREIHLVSSGKQSESLATLVGRTITVRLDELFPSHTAWHFGSAVSDKYYIVSESPVAGAGASSATQSESLEVPMVRNGGTYAVPVLINGAITLSFVLDSGATDVSIPSDVFRTLVRTGTVTERDIIGSETYTLADGSRKKATTFNIRSLKVGTMLIENVKGSVAEDSGPLLLGMSFLGRFPSWSVDNRRHVLILK